MGQYVESKIREICEYYLKGSGERISESTIYNISSVLTESLRNYLSADLRSQGLNVLRIKCADGTESKMGANGLMLAILLSMREKQDIDTADAEHYRNLLYNSGILFTHCKDSGRTYDGIDSVTGKYLMEHNCLDIIYELCDGKRNLMYFGYHLKDVFNMFIKSGMSVKNKKYALKSMGSGIPDLNIDDPLYELAYIQYKICKDKDGSEDGMEYYITERYGNSPRYKNKEIANKTTFVNYAKAYDISMYELMHRAEAEGYEIREAIRMGIEDRKRYGIMYEDDTAKYRGALVSGTRSGSILNLINYIRYLSAKESHTQPDFISREEKIDDVLGLGVVQ